MHIAEGVAPAYVAAGGVVVAAIGVGLGLRVMKDEQIPRAALMTAVIFTASVVIRLPLGPSGVHPLLNGLAGIVLGWAAFPAFLVCLFLQALFFQFGGITTLGINTVVMGLPAVTCFYLYGRQLRECRSPRAGFVWGAAAGATALLMSFTLWALALILCDKNLTIFAQIAAIPNLVLVAIEAVFTGFAASFLVRVYPEALSVPRLINEREAAVS
jgi:cobalt/nickel transport system permease protein